MADTRNTRTEIRIVGVMTGTSCDALDAACVALDDSGWRPLWTASRPYPADLRKAVLDAQKPGVKVTIEELLALQRSLGSWYGAALQSIIKRLGSPRPDLIANHGQTIAHFPGPNGGGSTLQLGDPSRIAAKTGLTVVSHFREGDLAAGGQGAPMVPKFHQILLDHLTDGKGRAAVHNLGGISNLSYLTEDEELIAFDTGPANLWIDAATERVTRGKQRYDEGGKLAAKAEPDFKAVKEILRMPYFRLKPPKSTGRDDFPFEILLKACPARDERLIATATAITAESIARAYDKFLVNAGFPVERIFFSGGGSKNRTLIRMIRERLPEQIQLQPIDETGLDGQYIEAQAFAVFGFLSLFGQPLGGSWTGAKSYGPPGWITPGENWGRILTKLQDLSDLDI